MWMYLWAEKTPKSLYSVQASKQEKKERTQASKQESKQAIKACASKQASD